jgi:hypothetical protein
VNSHVRASSAILITTVGDAMVVSFFKARYFGEYSEDWDLLLGSRSKISSFARLRRRTALVPPQRRRGSDNAAHATRRIKTVSLLLY